MKTKTILRGKENQDKLLSGLNKAADLVKTTLGNYGKNVIIGRTNNYPLITNDGVTVINSMTFEDETEMLALNSLREAANRTNYDVGDGTTTSVVLTQAIINKALEIKDKSVNEVSKDIKDSCIKVVAELNKSAKQISSIKDMTDVAVSSTEDQEMGEIVAKAVKEVGIDGAVLVEDGSGSEYSLETIKGMKKDLRLMSRFFTTEKNKAIYINTSVLVLKEKFNLVDTLERLIQTIREQQKGQLVIFAKGFDDVMMNELMKSKMKGFSILPIDISFLSEEEIDELALYVGAKVGLTDIGHADKIICDTKSTVIISGNNDSKAIKEKAIELKAKLKEEESEFEQDKLRSRIAALTGGIAIIKLPYLSETERGYIKHKVEDAVNSTKAAIEEGIVKGGGQALRDIKLDNILTECIKEPYRQIQINAGKQLDIPENIVDPVKVVRVALENACGVASKFITTGGSIADHESKLEEFKNVLNL